MDRGSHNRLGKDMEEVGAHRQNAFDPHTHQGRGGDKAAAGADAAGYQTRGQTDENGNQKNRSGIKGRRIGLLASQDVGGSPGGADNAEDRQTKSQQEQQLFAILEDIEGSLDVPAGVGLSR